jgi:hypothetical protein
MFGGRRILVLGESTHKDPKEQDPEKHEKHRLGINSWIPGYQIELGRAGKPPWGNFQKGVFHAFMTNRAGPAQMVLFWESVVFFNYITDLLAGHSMPPTREMWARAHQPLDRIVEHHTPDLIVVVGFRMWDEFQSSASPLPTARLSAGPTIAPAGRPRTLCYASEDGSNRTLLYAMRHPAARGKHKFKWQREHLPLQEVLSCLSGGV